MVTVSSEPVTFENLIKLFENSGFEKCFSTVDDELYYKYTDSHGNIFRYSFRRFLGNKHLDVYNENISTRYNLSHCAYFKFDDESEYNRLGFWLNLDSMQRCIEGKMDLRDEADIIIYGE